MKKVVLTLALFWFVGCATAPIRVENVQQGHWRARALIKDKEQSRSYIVNLNVNLKKDEKLRMDVTTALGTGVAALLADASEVRYVIFESKRFYFGKAQPDVMRPILSIPFDPRWLQNVLLDQPIAEKNWSCTTDGGGFVQECKDPNMSLKVTWSARQGEKKSVNIDHPKASVQINVQSFKAKVEDRKNLFVLEAPEGYQKLRVR